MESNVEPVVDPIVAALTRRAMDLSMSIRNPKKLAEILRKDLRKFAGDAATSYHIGATMGDTGLSFTVARIGPQLLVKLAGTHEAADLDISYKTTAKGWRIAVGISGTYYRPRGSEIAATFTLQVSR